ncbi:MAG: hypothetical protein MAG458_01271 [Nitrosopumilus sp.]|nr:hypothetical protein [Nitrosopumilus sp.]
MRFTTSEVLFANPLESPSAKLRICVISIFNEGTQKLFKRPEIDTVSPKP